LQQREFIFEKNTVYNNPPDPFFVEEPTLQHFAPEHYGTGQVYKDKEDVYTTDAAPSEE
jgi:hypothetical protein